MTGRFRHLCLSGCRGVLLRGPGLCVTCSDTSDDPICNTCLWVSASIFKKWILRGQPWVAQSFLQLCYSVSWKKSSTVQSVTAACQARQDILSPPDTAAAAQPQHGSNVLGKLWAHFVEQLILLLIRSNRIAKLTFLFLSCKSLHHQTVVFFQFKTRCLSCCTRALHLHVWHVPWMGLFPKFIHAPQRWTKSSELPLKDKWEFTKDPHTTKTEKRSILP